MMLTDIYYAAGEIEARAVRGPSWARLSGPVADSSTRRGGARRALGNGLVALGRLIAAEPQLAAR